MTVGEDSDIDQLVNQKLRFYTELTSHRDGPVQYLHHCSTNLSVSILLPSPLICEQDPKILEIPPLGAITRF